MKKNMKLKRKNAAGLVNSEIVRERLAFAVSHNEKELLAYYNIARDGLTGEQVENAREEYGNNVVTHGKVNPLYRRIFNAFVNPFTAILFVLAIVSVFTDIVLAAPEDKNFMTVVIITTMVM